jgi:hypothetical protein
MAALDRVRSGRSRRWAQTQPPSEARPGMARPGDVGVLVDLQATLHTVLGWANATEVWSDAKATERLPLILLRRTARA